MNLKKWVKIYKDHAINISSMSHDSKMKVGCVIVSPDFKGVLATGYNGKAKGLPNQRDSMKSGCSGYLHAEINAIINRIAPIKDGLVFVTHQPCYMCAQALINAEVSKVYYITPYPEDMLGIEALEKVGIPCIKI